ncbi:hypothetical protein GC163_17725 [bacterium]|nr:hypothetical protein [bacterium]
MERDSRSRTTLVVSAGFFIKLSVFFFISSSVIASAFGIARPCLVLNENQILYLFSTSAQVIAAVYGLTLTGFLFFRNELTREANEDETLEEPIDELEDRYFKLLVYITILVAITLLLANLAISHESSQRTNLSTIIINTGQSAYLVAFASIALFIFDVTAPHRIKGASQNLQNELDPSRDPKARGSLEAFIQNYNQIERLLAEAGQLYQSFTTASSQARQTKRISNMRLADILFRSERINSSLHQRLRDLITLRNAIIHGAEPIVSQEIVDDSARVLNELRGSLNSNSR